MLHELPGWSASESPPVTLPSDLPASTVGPDIAVTSPSEIFILELTACANIANNFTTAKRRKEDK